MDRQEYTRGEAAVPGTATGVLHTFPGPDDADKAALVVYVPDSKQLPDLSILGGAKALLCAATTRYSHLVKTAAQLGIPTIINFDYRGLPPPGTVVHVNGYTGKVSSSEPEEFASAPPLETPPDVRVRLSIADPRHIDADRPYVLSRFNPAHSNGPRPLWFGHETLNPTTLRRLLTRITEPVWWRIETRPLGSHRGSLDSLSAGLPEGQVLSLRLLEELAPISTDIVSLYLPHVSSAQQLDNFRAYLEQHFPGLSSSKLGVTIESKCAAASISDILTSAVSFVVLGTADFLADLLELDRDDRECSGLFTLNSPRVIDELSSLSATLRKRSLPLSVGIFDISSIQEDIRFLAKLGLRDFFIPKGLVYPTLLSGPLQPSLTKGETK